RPEEEVHREIQDAGGLPREAGRPRGEEAREDHGRRQGRIVDRGVPRVPLEVRADREREEADGALSEAARRAPAARRDALGRGAAELPVGEPRAGLREVRRAGEEVLRVLLLSLRERRIEGEEVTSPP